MKEKGIVKIATNLLEFEIGNRLFAHKLKEKEDSQFKLKIGTRIPNIIDTEDKRYIEVFEFKNLGQVTLKRKGNKLEITDRVSKDDINKRVRRKMKMLKTRAEKLFVESASNKLIDVSFVRTFLNPIVEILQQLIRNQGVSGDRSKQFKEEYPRYLKMLEENDLIEEERGEYEVTNLFFEKFKDMEGEPRKKVLSDFFGYVLRGNYNYITEGLQVKSIKPFIRIPTLFYINSLGCGDNLEWKINRFRRKYSFFYNLPDRQVKNSFESHLYQLSDAGVLKVRGERVTGDKKILNNMRENQSKVPGLFTANPTPT